MRQIHTAARHRMKSTPARSSFDDKDVTDLPARERDVAMVFQSYALYPTVRENIGFPLKM
ncbi:hypothetical protein GCM10007937_27870 [Mesorhizobium albiziae]|nr:hypothetical protein GCM10007937_27870 [Mesorhizobium albiziae]